MSWIKRELYISRNHFFVSNLDNQNTERPIPHKEG